MQNAEQTNETPLFYVNSARVRIAPYDFQFVLGQTKGPGPDNEYLVGNAITVVMSPEHAKAFSELLERNVRAFEEIVGPIKVGLKDDAKLPTPAAIGPARPSSRSRKGASSKASRRGKGRP